MNPRFGVGQVCSCYLLRSVRHDEVLNQLLDFVVLKLGASAFHARNDQLPIICIEFFILDAVQVVTCGACSIQNLAAYRS